MILLSSFPKSFKNFKEIIKNGRETISVGEIQNALNGAKLVDIKCNKKVGSFGEGLTIRRRLAKRNGK